MPASYVVQQGMRKKKRVKHAPSSVWGDAEMWDGKKKKKGKKKLLIIEGVQGAAM